VSEAERAGIHLQMILNQQGKLQFATFNKACEIVKEKQKRNSSL